MGGNPLFSRPQLPGYYVYLPSTRLVGYQSYQAIATIVTKLPQLPIPCYYVQLPGYHSYQFDLQLQGFFGYHSYQVTIYLSGYLSYQVALVTRLPWLPGYHSYQVAIVTKLPQLPGSLHQGRKIGQNYCYCCAYYHMIFFNFLLKFQVFLNMFFFSFFFLPR